MMRKDYKKTVNCPPAAPVCADCRLPNPPCPESLIFNCCTGAGVNAGIILPSGALLPPATPIPLVCAALDTTCLCKPIVTVKFNCIVDFSARPEPAPIIFQLKKSCDNGQEVVCGTWTFTINGFLSSDSADSFAFAFCDCNLCPGCCTYTVEIIDFEVAITNRLSLSINAPTIKVAAMETCSIQKADCYTPVTAQTYGNPEAKRTPAASVYADCKPKHPCPQDVIFNCCTGAGLQTTSVCPATPHSLVCVTLDTTCLCRPLVVLDFSTVITTEILTGGIITLIFQVKKICDNEQEIGCGSWTFRRRPRSGLTGTSDSFRFMFCDCLPCPGCCTYAVELISCRTIDPFVGTFSLNAPTATVLAVDSCPQLRTI